MSVDKMTSKYQKKNNKILEPEAEHVVVPVRREALKLASVIKCNSQKEEYFLSLSFVIFFFVTESRLIAFFMAWRSLTIAHMLRPV